MKRRLLLRLQRSLQRLDLRTRAREPEPVDRAWHSMLARIDDVSFRSVSPGSSTRGLPLRSSGPTALDEESERRLRAAEQALNRIRL